MSRANDRMEEDKKRLGIDSTLGLVERSWARIKLFTGSIRIPEDAATARTPESEEDRMVPLVIPPQFEVNRLIDYAKGIESQAKAGGLALSEHERQQMLLEATGARLKALTLHLGIETP